MGCGISTLEAEEASPSRRLNRHSRQRTIVPPLTNNSSINKKDFDNDDDSVVMVMKPLGDDKEEAKRAKEVGSNAEKLKEKCVMNKKEVEEERVVLESRGGKEVHVGDHDNNHAVENVKNNEEVHEEDNDRDDSFNGLGSPSFRDYCIDYDSTGRSSMADSNDYCDSGDSTMNSSGHDSINSKTMPKNERSVNSNKESEKRERRGRGFRNAITRGKGRGGRRNLLNFACYNASSESYAEGSMNKIVGKTA